MFYGLTSIENILRPLFKCQWRTGQYRKYFRFDVRTKFGRSKVASTPIFGGPHIEQKTLV